MKGYQFQRDPLADPHTTYTHMIKGSRFEGWLPVTHHMDLILGPNINVKSLDTNGKETSGRMTDTMRKNLPAMYLPEDWYDMQFNGGLLRQLLRGSTLPGQSRRHQGTIRAFGKELWDLRQGTKNATSDADSPVIVPPTGTDGVPLGMNAPGPSHPLFQQIPPQTPPIAQTRNGVTRKPFFAPPQLQEPGRQFHPAFSPRDVTRLLAASPIQTSDEEREKRRLYALQTGRLQRIGGQKGARRFAPAPARFQA